MFAIVSLTGYWYIEIHRGLWQFHVHPNITRRTLHFCADDWEESIDVQFSHVPRFGKAEDIRFDQYGISLDVFYVRIERESV